MSNNCPDIETVHSDINEKMPHKSTPDIQLPEFIKNGFRTNEILQKMQKRSCNKFMIFGCEFKRRQFWVLAGLVAMFMLSFVGTVVMWFTSTFDNLVFANLALVNNSASFEMWRKPSPKPMLKMHLFNYTNINEFEMGEAEKLNVQELGPYVYEESIERFNIKFNNATVSYQEERSYKFMPDLSIGRKQNDRVVVPNIPLFAAAAMYKHSSFLIRFAASRVLHGLNAKPFLTIPAHRFIVGYNDDLYSVSKSVLKLNNQKPYDNFGLLVGKIGLQNDIITMNTGVNDINKIAIIDTFNGQSHLEHWSTNECNDLTHATDGTMFSPKKIRDKRPVELFFKEMCRTLPLYYEKQVNILNGKIPAYRYTLPYNVFDAPDRLPSNQCYCNMDLGECSPQGVFNATPCALGAPAFISFPHFYNADPLLFNGVTGLAPNHTQHKTYADIHPTMGFVMAGKTRLQLNIQVIKSFGISQIDQFDDGLMLPIAWFEMALEDKTLPDEMVSIIFQTTFTLKGIENCLKYGFVIAAIVSSISILLILKNRWHKRERTSSMTPLQKTNDIVE